MFKKLLSLGKREREREREELKNVKFFLTPRNLIILGVVVVLGCTFAELMRDKHGNFKCFYQATRLFWRGIMPYGESWQANDPVDVFLYGPVFNIFFAPFAFLPKWLGPFLWNLCSLTIFAAGIFSLPKRFFSVPTKSKIFLYAFFILSSTILAMQINAMIAGMFLLSFSLLERGKPLSAIAIIMFSGAMKVYGICQLALLLCYPKFWRNMLYVLGIGAALIALPMLIMQVDDWWGYYSQWLQAMTAHKYNRPWETFYFMTPWRDISAAAFAIQLSTLAGLAALLFANYKKWQHQSFRAQALGILMSWMVVFSNCSQMHTHIITISGFMLWYWSRSERTVFDRIMFYAILVVVVLVPIDVVCPRVVWQVLCSNENHGLSLHLWLLTINLLRMCYLTCTEKVAVGKAG